MMNRGVMQRQMFAKGGAAFPDLSGGGQVTRKDILMGRGVPMQMGGEPQMALNDYLGGQTDELAAEAARLGISKEQLLELLNQQKPVGMAMGGDPAMAQGVGSMMPPAQGPMGDAQAVDPQVLEGLLSEASQSVGDLENAEDYETVINSIRGDDAPISARYEELASVVGEEDAAQTPESVLALTQPAIMMGAVDQGIGGLAQEEMSEPVEGAMAQGIMSTVAPPQPAAPGPMMDPAMMGGPPPVNFNQGGLVRRGDNQPVVMMQAGGDPFAATPGRLGELTRERMAVREGLLGDPAGRLQEQKNLTQAQMLFDIANTALAFAAPMQGETPGMSAAERLAMAARTTQLPQTIGARAAQLGEFKTGLDKEKQALQLAAIGSAETALASETKAAADAALAGQKAKAAATENALDRAATTGNIVLKGSVDMEAAESKENWRAAAADTQRLAEKEAATLLASRNLAAQDAGKKLQNQLDISRMLLDSELTLDRLGVEDAYKLNQQQIGHGYAMTLQEANLKVTRARDANNVALKLADQEIEEAKMLQTAERDAATARINQRKQALEEEKLELEQAAKGLETFGKTGKNKAQSILANPKLLEGYAKGTLDKTQTIQVSNAIDLLSTKETLPGPEGTTILTGGSIPEAARLAVIERSKLPKPNDKTRLMPRDVERITAEPLEFGEAVNTLMSSVPDVSVAFGSDAVARNVLNVATEALSFGFAKAPYEATEKAVSAVNQLNLNTLTHFQKVLELRDSVALMNKLEKQTANPKEFLTGDTRAKSKTKTVLDTIDEAVAILDLQIQNATDIQEANKHKLAKQRTFQLRAGFEAIERAYEKIGSGGTAITSEIETEQDSILKNIIGKKKKGAK
jgi:hypothetical protein